jgi:hypothetical protein
LDIMVKEVAGQVEVLMISLEVDAVVKRSRWFV